jgi:hypothetical protein
MSTNERTELLAELAAAKGGHLACVLHAEGRPERPAASVWACRPELRAQLLRSRCRREA